MTNEKKCPQCAELIKTEAKKCKHCGEWLETEAEEKKEAASMSPVKAIAIVVTLIVFAFIGFVMEGWVGIAIGVVIWMICAGWIMMIGANIADVGEYARRNKKQRR